MRLFSNRLQLARTPAYRYQQIIDRDESLEAPTSSELRHYHEQLQLLATILPASCCDWQIEGGMAVAMHDGKFSRRHGDVDVAVFEHQLHDVERQIMRRGYRLFSRNSIHILEYVPWDLLRSFNADKILARQRVKRLTAVKVDAQGRVDSEHRLLPRFDLHIHRLERDVVMLDRATVAFPRELFCQTKTVEFAGHRITVASLPLMYYYKLGGTRRRHRSDLDIIEQHEEFSALDRERAYELFASSHRSEKGAFTQSKPLYEPADHNSEYAYTLTPNSRAA